MDSKTQVMVALGAAIGVNCIPCFDHLYAKARETGVADEDVREIIQTATKVKSGAASFLKQAVEEQVGAVEDEDQPCCGPAAGCNC
jgi:alkylhydroperoxidase/carboxymuconolactone decarboxylase family protein YurZ